MTFRIEPCLYSTASRAMKRSGPWVAGIMLALGIGFLGAENAASQTPSAQQPAAKADRAEQSQPDAKKKKQKKSPKTLAQKDVYRRLLKSTCWIRCWQQREDDQWEGCEGTGWVVDADRCLVITNEHVIAGYDEAEFFFPVKRDGRVVIDPDYYVEEVEPIIGEVIDCDTRVDLALVKLESLPDGIIALPLAKESPEPGERVFSLAGFADGSEGLWTFTAGEVRQVYRRSHARGHVARVVETQLPTNPGNSGGPVVNDRGEVVAVVEGHMLKVRLVSMFIDVHEVRDYLEITRRLADPKTADDYNDRGTRRHDAERYDGAIADYTEALKLERDRPVILANRGWAFYAKEDYDAALADFADALKRDPDLATAFEGRGTVHRERGDYEKAIKDLSEAIRRDPDDAGLYQRRGTAYELDGQLQLALADRNRAVKLDRTNVDYYYQRGQTLRKLKKFDKAVKSFEKALKLDPSKIGVFYEIGYCYQDQKNWGRATLYYTVAIERDDQVPQFFNNRGLCHWELENHDESVRDFIAAIKLRPESGDYHRRLGGVLHDAGSYKLALQALTKAIELNPDDALAYWWRAKCHRQMGNEQAAENDQQKSEELENE